MDQLDAHCPLVDGQGHAPDRPQSAPAPSKFLEQMMARLVEALPAGRWLYELKFGGYRALAFKAGRQVTLLSRNRTIFNDDYRQLML